MWDSQRNKQRGRAIKEANAGCVSSSREPQCPGRRTGGDGHTPPRVVKVAFRLMYWELPLLRAKAKVFRCRG